MSITVQSPHQGTAVRSPTAVLFWALAAAIAVTGVPGASAQQDSGTVVRVRVVPEVRTVPPGGQVPVAIVLDIKEGWHINSASPVLPDELDFFEAIPTSIEVTVPAGRGIVAHPQRIQWPREQRASLGFLGESSTYGVYGGRAIAYLPVSIDDQAPPGGATITVGVGFQACSDTVCLSPTPPHPIRCALTITDDAVPVVDAVNRELFRGFDSGVWQRLKGVAETPETETNMPAVVFDLLMFGGGFAVTPHGLLGGLLFLLMSALGGFALNLMPCVLPVLPIKVMALGQVAMDRRRCFLLGVAMSLGVIVFWLGLGVAMATVSRLATINGLYQFPLFTIGIGVFIAAMAVSMCGLFDARLPAWVYALDPSRETLPGAFGYGVMTAVLATPCAAPFMGTAVAWSLRESPPWILATFGAIGVGMAAPYLVLTAFPALLSRVPRAGPGSVLLKQVMGLLMLAAAVYFIGAGLSGLMAESDGQVSKAYWYMVAVVVAVAGAWLVIGGARLNIMPMQRGVLMLLGVLLAATAVAGGKVLTRPGPIAWQYYTPQRHAAALAEGKVILLDFTAETCINCKVLEHFVLHDERVVTALREPGVVPMKVDLTGDNEAGWQKLAAVGSVHIPRLVVVDPRGQETLNAEIYTAEQVLKAIVAAQQQ